MSWFERALEGAPADVVERYREVPDYLERALRGIDDEAKVSALRAMVNLGVRPDDELNVIVALLGYFTQLGRAIPESMRTVVEEMDDRLNGFVEATAMFNETTKALLSQTLDEIQRHAIEMGKVGVQSSGVEEMEKHRYRLTILTKDVLEAFKTQVQAEAKATVSAKQRARDRVTAALVACALVVVGVVAGWVVTSTHAPASSQAAYLQRQGEVYVRMWNDPSMPADVRTWIRRWSGQRSSR